MGTELIVLKSGGNWNYFVQVQGLDTLMRFLKDSDPKMRKALQDGLKDAAQPVLTRARANARAIADDGTYANSLSLRSGTGTKRAVLLRSSDVAAPVKEFAHPGATYVPKPTDKRHNARKMKSFPVGVPHRANAPRVMVPAVNDSVGEVRSRIEAKLEEVLGRASG